MKPVRALTFGGLLAAIHIIATIMLHFGWVPGLELVILFVVPFFSAMFAYKCRIKESLIYVVATLLICTLISPTAGLLYILPTLAVGVVYGELVKHKANGTTLVYVLTVVEFGLFFVSAYILKLFTDVEVLKLMQSIFHLERSNDKFLALGLLLGYSFMQGFLLHFIMKAQLKRLGVNVVKTENPPLWVVILGIASLIACFMSYSDETFVIFTIAAAVIFGSAIALHGYRISDRPWILLAIQAIVFLGASLPLIYFEVFKDHQEILPYIIMFVPPVFYSLYHLIMNTYVSTQPKKIDSKKSKK